MHVRKKHYGTCLDDWTPRSIDHTTPLLGSAGQLSLAIAGLSQQAILQDHTPLDITLPLNLTSSADLTAVKAPEEHCLDGGDS